MAKVNIFKVAWKYMDIRSTPAQHHYRAWQIRIRFNWYIYTDRGEKRQDISSLISFNMKLIQVFCDAFWHSTKINNANESVDTILYLHIYESSRCALRAVINANRTNSLVAVFNCLNDKIWIILLFNVIVLLKMSIYIYPYAIKNLMRCLL